MLTLRIISLVTMISYSGLGYCYNLADHDLITNRAVAVFNYCQPTLAFSDYEAQVIAKGNRSEDFNLASKWLKNSHYYNPNRWVRTLYRGDASHRLESLVEKPRTIYRLGQIVHFLQDVTSPPHVAPIAHGPNDGFESFFIEQQQILNDSISCQSQPTQQPLTILKVYAQQTLTTFDDLTLAERDGRRFEFSWRLFWSEGLGSKFGYYGFFGNNFGSNKPIKILGHSYSFRQETFRLFKRQQLTRAVEATTQAMSWYRNEMSIQ